eukprot:scpid30676/ scgid2182/ 
MCSFPTHSGTISCNISSDGVVRVREGEDFFHISCSLSGFQGNIKVVATEGTVVADQSDLRPSTETRQLLVQYASQAESLQGRCLNVISDGLTTGFCFDVAIIGELQRTREKCSTVEPVDIAHAYT